MAAAIALDGAELGFALYHSSRIRGIIDLPLRVDDNALASMVQNGDLKPR